MHVHKMIMVVANTYASPLQALCIAVGVQHMEALCSMMMEHAQVNILL